MSESLIPKFWLISDLDDTIKISNTQSKWNTVYRGLFRSSAFAGMAELYRELLKDTQDSFYIVSSSPPAIRKKIEFFLNKNNFPKANVILRDWLRESSVVKYKMGRILKLVEAAPCPVILIGDDTEHDPEVLAHVLKRFPEKVLATYIRTVRGRELPEKIQGFFTAFELACFEHSAGRLSSDQVLLVGEAVLRAKKNSRLIPRFSLKPPLNLVPIFAATDTALLELWKKIQNRIESMPKRKTKR